MATYEVTSIVEPSLIEAYEHYMREHHIPAILATGCFQGAVFTRATRGRYRMCYEARSDEELQRYFTTFASKLREEFTSSFPNGVALSREVWIAIQSWDTSRAAD